MKLHWDHVYVTWGVRRAHPRSIDMPRYALQIAQYLLGNRHEPRERTILVTHGYILGKLAHGKIKIARLKFEN